MKCPNGFHHGCCCWVAPCSKCGKREEHHIDSPACLMEQVKHLNARIKEEQEMKLYWHEKFFSLRSRISLLADTSL